MKNIRIIIIVCLLTLPLLSLAASSLPSFPYWATNGLVSCSGDLNSPNPCTSLCDLLHTFLNVVYFGITLVVFVIAPVLFAYGGILIMIGHSSIEEIGGKQISISKGKGIITSTVWAVVIALAAYLIVSVFLGILGQSFGTLNCTPAPTPTTSAGGGTYSTLQDIRNNTGCTAGQTCIQDVNRGAIYFAAPKQQLIIC